MVKTDEKKYLPCVAIKMAPKKTLFYWIYNDIFYFVIQCKIL